MAFIKSVIFSFIVLVWVALPNSSFASEDDILIEKFRKSLAGKIRAEMTDQFHIDFKDSGLSPSDVDRVIADVEDSIESCFVVTTVNYAQIREIPLADLITEEDGDFIIRFEGNEGAEFGELLTACTNDARAQAGIVMK